MTTMTLNHRIAKVNGAGVTCVCGEVAEDRASFRIHKGGAAAVVSAPAVAPVEEFPADVAIKIVWEAVDCGRCGGTGRMPYAAYGGVCFKCNGGKQVLTPAGRSAFKLYTDLMDAASTRVEAWAVEVGMVVSYVGQRRWFTVVGRDFSSTSGAVMPDGRVCSAVLNAKNGTAHYVGGMTEMAVKPERAVIRAIMVEVARRRKGATLTAA